MRIIIIIIIIIIIKEAFLKIINAFLQNSHLHHVMLKNLKIYTINIFRYEIWYENVKSLKNLFKNFRTAHVLKKYKLNFFG